MDWPRVFDDMGFEERAGVWAWRAVWLLLWPVRLALWLLATWLDAAARYRH